MFRNKAKVSFELFWVKCVDYQVSSRHAGAPSERGSRLQDCNNKRVLLTNTAEQETFSQGNNQSCPIHLFLYILGVGRESPHSLPLSCYNSLSVLSLPETWKYMHYQVSTKAIKSNRFLLPTTSLVRRIGGKFEIQINALLFYHIRKGTVTGPLTQFLR